MVCSECNGTGKTVYFVEVDRDENSVTCEKKEGICRTCNGSGEKTMTNGDKIRAMNDTELAYFMAGKLTDLYSTQKHDEGKPLTATYIGLMQETWFRVLMQYLRMPAEGSARIETNMYDKEETFPNCTVQVLTNTVTGETSVGWWKNGS